MYTMWRKTRSTCHTLSMLDLCMVLGHTSPMVYVGNLSLVPTRTKHAPTPGRSFVDQRRTGPAIVLGHLILSPLRQPWSRGERFRPSGYTATSTYWAHITSMRSIRSILAHGYQPSVLNRHRRGLPHKNLGIAIALSLPFPSECSTGPSN
jgi:hypothetical protein